MFIAASLFLLFPTDITIKTDYYTLTAPTGLDADAADMASALDHGIEQLVKQFAPFEAAELLRKANVSIQLHARPGDKAAPGLASIETGTTDGTVGTYFAKLHILAPSAHPADAKTAANEPMDAKYCQRVIVHEYSTVLLELICRDRPAGPTGTRGWQFFTAPAWFVQGYEEYLGLTCGDEKAGKVTLEKYITMVKSNTHWVSCDFGLDVAQPYTSGPVLLHFMHQRYGGDRVRAILFSPQATFGRAVRSALGVGLDQFCEDWAAWLAAVKP